MLTKQEEDSLLEEARNDYYDRMQIIEDSKKDLDDYWEENEEDLEDED
jgi:hypothetical protein